MRFYTYRNPTCVNAKLHFFFSEIGKNSAFRTACGYLYEFVENGDGQHANEKHRAGHGDDYQRGCDFQDIGEQGPHGAGDLGVHHIHVFTEAVHHAAHRRGVKEGHGQTQDVPHQVRVDEACGVDPSQGLGDGVREDQNA